MDFRTVLTEFRARYAGPPLTLVIAGGGVHAALLGAVPGSSRFLNSVHVLWSQAALRDWLARDAPPRQVVRDESLCSAQAARAMVRAARIAPADGLVVAATAALTTDRPRRGDNRAFISTSRGETYLLNLPRLTEQQHVAALTAARQAAPHGPAGSGAAHLGDIDTRRAEEDELLASCVLAIAAEQPVLKPALPPGASLTLLHPSGED